MDNMFQLRQNMTQEEKLRFEQDSLQQEQNVEEYLSKLQIDAAKLMQQQMGGGAAAPAPAQPIVADMPQQQVDEKESKRRRREKNQFKEQTKLLEKNRKKEREDRQDFAQRAAGMQQNRRVDQKAAEIFEETIRADMLSPRYVLEHFAEVREKLDAWRDHIRLFEEGGAANFLTTREQTLRLPLMQNMYVQAEQAFRSALGALGYSYNEQETGTDMFLENLTAEQKQQALEQNIAQRTRIAESAASMDETVAQQLLEEEAPTTHAGIENFREEMSQKEEYNFIETQSLSHEYQYEELEKAKSLLENHPEEYAQHKELLDQMYHELFNLMELNGKYYENSQNILKIQFDKNRVSSKRVQMRLQKSLDEQGNKMRLSRNRALYIQAGIKHVLLGKALTKTEIRMLKDYLPEEFAQAGRTAEIEAGDYADRYREKKAIFESLAEHLFGERAQDLISGDAGRFMMFMEPGQEMHNEAVLRALETRKACNLRIGAGGEDADAAKQELGRAVKPIVLPYLTRMRDFDTQELENCTDEELMERNEELQDLYISGMQAVDTAKCADPDDEQGRSIKEVFCGDKKELFALKCSVVQSYAVKARSLCMMRAYTQGTLSEACYTEAEQGKMRRMFGVAEGQALTAAQMLAFTRDGMEKAIASQDAAYNRYFSTESIKESYRGLQHIDVTEAHPAFMDRLLTSLQNGKAALKLKPNEVLGASDCKDYYAICKKRVEEIERDLPGATEEAASDMQTELTELKQDMEKMQIHYALSKNNYRRTGDSEPAFREPIFRSYTSINGLPSFRNMSDEEFRRMCVQLSAGALQEDKQEPARLEAYYAENMQGFQTYKQHMSEHYEMLEERFHHKVPSTEYVLEHQEELKALFANIQLDNNIVERMRDLFDLTKPEDLRLFHLVEWYNALGSYVTGIGIAATAGMESYQEALKVTKHPLSEVKESLAYLNEPKEQVKEGPQTEAEAEKTATIEKFRQFGADTAHILTADDATKIEYLRRANELREYIRQHSNDRTLNMRQFKGWYEMAEKKLPYLAKDMFHHFSQQGAQPVGEDAFPALAQQLSTLQLTEEMFTDEYITFHIEELLASFKAMDDYRRLVEGNPGLEDNIPAGQRVAWVKNRGIYEKYRDYVTQFARTRYVDITNGAYLTEETHQEESKELAQNLQKEKEGMQDLLGGFANYSQKIKTIADSLTGIKKVDADLKTKILKPLQEAGEWMKDLTVYLNKPLLLSQEDYFDATIMTLMSMFGYIEKDLRLAMEPFAGNEEAIGSALCEAWVGQMKEMTGAFAGFKERVPGYAQELRGRILQSGEEIPLTIRDIVISAQELKTFRINGQQANVGVGASDVFRVKEGEKEFFFKGEETVRPFSENMEELVPLLGNEELANILMRAVRGIERYPDVELSMSMLEQFGQMLSFVKPGDFMEVQLNEINGFCGKDAQGNPIDIRNYLGTEEAKARFVAFAKEVSKRHTSRMMFISEELDVDMGTNMTARNFASEQLAELLGLKGMIVRNRSAVIVEQDGTKKKGFIMDQAKGIAGVQLKELASELRYTIHVTPEAQKMLLNLQILDNISGQTDRHTGNFFVQYDRDDEARTLTIKDVTGIDNDFAFGKSKRIGTSNTASIMKTVQVENAEGVRINELQFALPIMDKKMYESLMSVSPELLATNLEGIIEPQYMDSLKERYETVRQKIREAKMKADSEGRDFFHEREGWGEETERLLAHRPTSRSYIQDMDADR